MSEVTYKFFFNVLLDASSKSEPLGAGAAETTLRLLKSATVGRRRSMSTFSRTGCCTHQL